MEHDYKDMLLKANHLLMIHRYYLFKATFAIGIYPGQPQILEVLLKNGESSQREIAKKIHVSPSSVTVSIKRMQKAGLVEKSPNENDLRYNKIKITERGKEVLRKCEAEFNMIDSKMFSGFTDEEIVSFKNTIERIIGNLSAEKIEPEEICSFFDREKKKEELLND